MTKKAATATPPAPEGPARGEATKDVHDTLRGLILSGELQPGSEVSQLELSRDLGVSRTPLREALRLLEREGLVLNNGPNRLVQVSPLSMADLDDLYSLRVMGEALAIWLTVPALAPRDFEQLERDLKLTSDGDAEAHRRFHDGLRLGAGERLRAHLQVLFEHAGRYQWAFAHLHSEEMAARLSDEHRAILDACIARDRQRARELIVDHLATTAIGVMTSQRHAPYSLPAAMTLAKAPLDAP